MSTDQVNPEYDPNRIEASPTKQLFIDMLVKDITLRDAIGDLIDNSVDAAKKAAGLGAALSGYVIKVKADGNFFQIYDNCNGLEADVARKSAFCFGKPKNYVQGEYTIGQFGIGMKRAFFKIGNYIEVRSIAPTSSFIMHIDVPTWREQVLWDFSFDEVREKQNNLPSNTFTQIIIKELIDDAKEKFDEQFINSLIKEIALEHVYTINRGLTIEINGITLKAKDITLTYDKVFGIEPVYWKHTFKNNLEAEIIAGVSEDKGADGGWYIFCNERLILGPDTTEITGWSGGSGSKEMPKYHDQFFRFRGYVFFKADNSSKLPWNTTKTGMDLDSPAFLLVRNQMIIIAKQVKKLMDDMKKERERGNPITNRLLSKAVAKAAVLPVSQVMAEKTHLPKVYKYPEQLLTVAPKAKKQGVKITFYKPDSVVDDVKKYFKVDDADSAGSLAFDNFYENEIGL